MQKFDEVDATSTGSVPLMPLKTLGWYFLQILPDPHVNGQWLSF